MGSRFLTIATTSKRLFQTTVESREDQADNLSDLDKKHLSYVWRLLGGEDLGSLPVRQLGRVLRGFGKNPTEHEIQYIKYETGIDDNQRLLYSDFINLYTSCAPGIDSEQKLLEAFRVFDNKNAGKIKSEDMRDILTRLGEPLTQDEVNKMFRIADTERNGFINYEDFCKVVMSDNRPTLKI